MIDAPLARCSPFFQLASRTEAKYEHLAVCTEHYFNRLVRAGQILPLATIAVCRVSLSLSPNILAHTLSLSLSLKPVET